MIGHSAEAMVSVPINYYATVVRGMVVYLVLQQAVELCRVVVVLYSVHATEYSLNFKFHFSLFIVLVCGRIRLLLLERSSIASGSWSQDRIQSITTAKLWSSRVYLLVS